MVLQHHRTDMVVFIRVPVERFAEFADDVCDSLLWFERLIKPIPVVRPFFTLEDPLELR